jgi:hypothetical protein
VGKLLKDSGGTDFWHEMYLMQFEMGFMKFAPVKPARGSMFDAAHRAGKQHDAEPVVGERELYGCIDWQ